MCSRTFILSLVQKESFETGKIAQDLTESREHCEHGNIPAPITKKKYVLVLTYTTRNRPDRIAATLRIYASTSSSSRTNSKHAKSSRKYTSKSKSKVPTHKDEHENLSPRYNCNSQPVPPRKQAKTSSRQQKGREGGGGGIINKSSSGEMQTYRRKWPCCQTKRCWRRKKEREDGRSATKTRRTARKPHPRSTEGGTEIDARSNEGQLWRDAIPPAPLSPTLPIIGRPLPSPNPPDAAQRGPLLTRFLPVAGPVSPASAGLPSRG